MKKIINTTNAPAAIGPYAQATQGNGVLYISGQIPVDSSTGLIAEGIENQTHQVMKNLQTILNEAGLNFSHVMKASIFLKNMGNFVTVNEIYGSYFVEGQYPARETIEVSALPRNVDIEISMIVHQD